MITAIFYDSISKHDLTITNVHLDAHNTEVASQSCTQHLTKLESVLKNILEFIFNILKLYLISNLFGAFSGGTLSIPREGTFSKRVILG